MRRPRRARSAGKRKSKRSKIVSHRTLNSSVLGKNKRITKKRAIQEKIYQLADYLDANKVSEEKKRLRELKKQRRMAKKRANASAEHRVRQQQMQLMNALQAQQMGL